MKALVVIDIQNDYFAGGRFPLEGAEEALQNALVLIETARSNNDLVVVVKHLAPAGAPFFETGSSGANLHPSIQSAMKDAPQVIKHEADSFLHTNLAELLRQHKVDAVDLVGMMTQHCVTHTALSPEAAGYPMTIHANACAAPTRALSALALSGLKARHSVV
ncbi:isochorismatase family protein [Stenotrophomonas sp.]|uniref:isochorismatase family protein n=1 Tax=Stenotrophomonas sp. TaxID=69392 RepID=UPI0029BED283|nr:isochorismatase family protein [Stenotrophomonas sp.]MDX3933880.1 isochorismatase family protein [Stenotrophomonas sp.]